MIHDPNIQTMMLAAHRIAKDHGWWGDDRQPYRRNILEAIALIHSECSEALEEFRARSVVEPSGEAPLKPGETVRKPVGFGVELADVVIRVFDLAEGLNIPLADLIWQKMEYNEQREWRHGGKQA